MPDWSQIKSSGKAVVAAIPALGGIAALAWLFWRLLRAEELIAWWTLGKLAIAVGLAFGVAAVLRFAISPLLAAAPTPQTAQTDADADAAMRRRIAPLVLAIGSVAIIALALGLAAAFMILAMNNVSSVQSKIDALLTGIFSAVLPVFATWVGTIIAFYFTNESFRQAAQVAREATAGTGPAQPKVTERMLVYDKIGKIEVPRNDARGIPMSDVIGKFSAPVTRVPVFDVATRQPIFVLRQKLVPAAWFTALPPNLTVNDYLAQNGGANASDATQFSFVAQTATIDVARTAMKIGNCVDLFVTASGQKTEQTVGWLTDDMLK